MIVIELCGIPGCGKSTLISKYKNQDKDIKILTRDDLFSSSKIIRNLQIRTKLITYRILGGRVNHDKVFEALFKVFPNASIHSKVRLMDLYKRISKIKGNGVLLLEEGPIQYLSALSFDKKIHGCEEIRDYWSLFGAFDYYALYCECSNETSINRMKNRNKANGYYNPSRNNIGELLNIKRTNIQEIISYNNINFKTINMEDSLDCNIAHLGKFVKSVV